MTPNSKIPSSRPTRRAKVAVLIDYLDGEYHRAILDALQTHARLADLDLVLVAGGILGAEGSQGARNFAFDLVSPLVADAELLVSAPIGNAIGAAGLAAWAARRPAMPRFSIGIPLAGIPSTTVDNRAGMRAAVSHLIEAHGLRRIAFISGPSTSPDTVARLEGYGDALAANGIERDDRIVAEGSFKSESGARAVRVLLDERRVALGALDAIAAANDEMAIGAMDELARRSVDVPERIAIVGFDDLEIARLCTPSLTTVRQPTAEQARQAITSLLGQIRGEHADPLTSFPTHLIVRRSCGCYVGTAAMSEPPEPTPTRSFEVSFMLQRERLHNDVVRAARGELGAAGTGWEQKVVGALLESLQSNGPGAFVRSLEDVVSRIVKSGSSAEPIARVLIAMRRRTLACLPAGSDRRGVVENIFAAGSELLTEARVRAEMDLRRSAAEQLGLLQVAAQDLLVTTDPTALGPVAARVLPPLGIEAACVAVLAGKPAVDTPAEIVLAYAPGRVVQGRSSFPAGQLAPPDVLQGTRGITVVVPIPLPEGGRAFAVLVCTAFEGRVIEQVGALLGGAATLAIMARRLRQLQGASIRPP